MRYLRQSTASQEIILGPFVDSTDGSTAETGLTIANTDIKVYKAGATTSANKNSGGATHDAAGRYYATLDATDTDTLGSGEIHVSVAGALPVKMHFTILPANIFDSMISGTDLFDVSVTQFGGTAGTFASGRPEVNTSHLAGTAVSATSGLINANVTQISGDSAAADSIEAHFDDTAGAYPLYGIVDRGTAQSATSTTLVLRSAVSFADDALIGATIVITGGSTGVGESRRITDYVGSTDTATVEAWTVTPTGTITYVIYGTAADSGGSGGNTAAEIRAAVGLASANLDTQLAAIDDAIDTEIAALTTNLATANSNITTILADTNDIQTRIPAALVSGRMDASVGAMAAGVVTAAAVATGAIDADALATDAVAEIADGVWDEVISGHLTAGTTGAALNGAGSAGDPWTTPLPGAYGAGTAGYLVGTNLDAPSSVIDTVVDAIKAKTDNLPTDPADASVVAGLIAATEAKVDIVDTVVDAIKAKTDSLTFGTANVVDAHIKYVAGEQVTGSGTTGDPWGPV